LNQIANIRKTFALRAVGLRLLAELIAFIVLVMAVSLVSIFAGIPLTLVGVVIVRAIGLVV